MYIVVTGAAGFVGANLVKALNARGERQILAVDNLANAAKVEPVGEFRIEGDQEAPGRLQRARHGLVRGLRGLTQPSCQVLGRLQLRNRLSFWSHDINCKRESLSKGGSRCDSARGRDYLQISTR